MLTAGPSPTGLRHRRSGTGLGTAHSLMCDGTRFNVNRERASMTAPARSRDAASLPRYAAKPVATGSPGR